MTKGEELPAYCFYRVFPPENPKQMSFDRHYLMYAASGAIRLSVVDRTWSLPPTRAAWIPAGTPITITIAQPMTCCSVLFRTDFIPQPVSDCRVFSLSQIARDMIWHARRWGPERAEFDPQARHYFLALALMCTDLASQPAEHWIPSGRSDPVKRAIAHSAEHLSRDVEFAAVAKAAGLSERALARRFSNEIGMSWGQLLRRIRMIRAVELMAEPGSRVLEVAHQVGYASPSAFAKAFRAFTGQSPAGYRASLDVNRAPY